MQPQQEKLTMKRNGWLGDCVHGILRYLALASSLCTYVRKMRENDILADHVHSHTHTH